MYQITRTAITRTVLALTFIALAATAQADPRNQSGSWKLNGNGYPGDVTVQQALDGRLSGRIYGEGIIGFYAPGERVGVWLRVPAGLEPMQAFVGEASADGLNFSGRLYALNTLIAGGSSTRNVFSFKAQRAAPGATPVVPSDPGVLPPAPAQQGPDSVAGTYQIKGNGYTGTLNLIQARDGTLTGTIYGQRLNGLYASGTGSIAFIRSSSPSLVTPYQLFVGTVTPQGGIKGDFYALTGEAGASTTRMKYSWTSWRGTGAPVAAYFTNSLYSDRLTSTRIGPAVFETLASGSEPIDYFWTVDGVPVDPSSTRIMGGGCNGATVSFPRRDRMELSNLPSTCHKVLIRVAIENPGTPPGARPTRTVLLQLDGMPPPIAANITRSLDPRSVTIVPGGNVEFSMQAEADGGLPITNFWYIKDSSGNTQWNPASPAAPISGGPCDGTRVTFPPQMPLPQMNRYQSVMRLENVPLTCNGAGIFVFVRYTDLPEGSVTATHSSLLNVVVPTPAGITNPLVHPRTVEQGGSIDFTVTATGTLPIDYSWTIDSMAISTSPGLTHPPTVSAGRCQGATVLFPTPNVMRLGNVPLSCDTAVIGVRVANVASGASPPVSTATLSVSTAPPLPIPPNALTATQIVAGNEWSMALRPDRTVWAWGSGQWINGTVASPGGFFAEASRPTQMYPSVLTDVRAISGWSNSFWALKGTPGTTFSRVLHWGDVRACSDGRGSDGQNNTIGIGTCNPTRFNDVPKEMHEIGSGIPRPVDRVCAIAGGGGKLIMIRAVDNTGNTTNCDAGSQKTVWYVGSLGGSPSLAATSFIQQMPGLPSDSPPAVIFAGQTTSGSPPLVIALEDGRIYALGDSPYLGLGVAAASVGNSNGPLQLPTNWGSARLFGMSYYSSLFVVRADGSVVSSGTYEAAGELGNGRPDGSLRPWSIRGPCSSSPCEVLTGVTAIASTNSLVTLALENGRILGWGASNSFGLRGPNVGFNSPYPQVVPSTVSGFTALSASHTHALVIGPGNVVYAWGSNQRGALGNGTINGQRTAPEMVTTGP
jgi:alpha-tubulin suppressor-like RCC1 family protein